MFFTHLENIHIHPLVCDETECTVKKPFGRAPDLRRHRFTVHGDQLKVECPVPECGTTTRKDKMLEHTRKYHRRLQCTHNHCAKTVVEGQEEAHVQEQHGLYECALGACEGRPKSYFLLTTLRLHARYHHGLETHTFNGPDIEEIHDKTIRANMYPRRRATTKDCQYCLAPHA